MYTICLYSIVYAIRLKYKQLFSSDKRLGLIARSVLIEY